AFDSKLGYLTRCPTNLGTGLRAGVMLHLPILTESGAMKNLIAAAGKLGFAVRGLYGEGTVAQGALYQISNQVTLGVTEEEIVSRLERVVTSILYQERGLRSRYLKEYSDQIRDRVWRAAGILATARILPLQEAMTLLSDVRLGLSCKILAGISMEELNTILFEMQPNCMMAASGCFMNNLERDQKRAGLVREIIGKAVK
ncbi:MAG: ATP--guanido phosphotransferase, partial [Oscillospiraceae bacterium]|nr:ATP--guanido phosphotransferase [Oscillospiraceae bacterium]